MLKSWRTGQTGPPEWPASNLDPAGLEANSTANKSRFPNRDRLKAQIC